MATTASSISMLYNQARLQMQATVRSWYPGLMFFDLPEFSHGNLVARMCSWQNTALRLANTLGFQEAQMTFGSVASYDALLPSARMNVGQAVHEMWPGARAATMPLGATLSASEEFTQYHLGAQNLAMQLAPLCSQAYAMQMGSYSYNFGYTDPEHTVPGTLYGSNPSNPTDLRDPRDPNDRN